MEFVAPRSWADALAARAEHPGCTPIAGGTDVMVELNFDRHRPDVLLDLTKVPELREWSRTDDGGVRLGAGVTYLRVMTELGDLAPGLAMASRTVGSPQIRARGTVGGNVGSASPAGDCHPVLLAVGATVEVESAARGARQHPGRRLLHRREEERAGAGRADRRGPSCRRRPGRSSSPRSAPATRWSSRSRPSGWRCTPTGGRVGAAIGSAAPTPRHAVGCRGLRRRRAATGTRATRCPTRWPTEFGRLVGRGGQPDRRRPRHRRLPAARPGRARPPGADLGVGATTGGPH